MYCHCITIANINQEQWRRACRPVAWSPGNEKHACMKTPGYTRNVCPGGRWQRPRGFTLIEMMVVVALVAILAALAAPSFIAQIANQRVSSAALELQSLLQLARSEPVYKRVESSFVGAGQTWSARSGGQLVRVSLDPDAGDGSASARSSHAVLFD